MFSLYLWKLLMNQTCSMSFRSVEVVECYRSRCQSLSKSSSQFFNCRYVFEIDICAIHYSIYAWCEILLASNAETA